MCVEAAPFTKSLRLYNVSQHHIRRPCGGLRDVSCSREGTRSHQSTQTKAHTLSTESIVSSSQAAGVTESCPACGAALAADQRYCLQCGERRVPMSSVMLGGPPNGAESSPPTPGPVPPYSGPPREVDQRGNTVAVIAGVGVLLLAMGVGVLIGRSSVSKQSSAPPSVITVGTGSTTTAGSSPTSTESSAFTDDWPAGTNGFTVQLQTLPEATTQTSAVEAAKTAASGKGAKEVGALKSADFQSLTTGNYLIYSGVYRKKAEAEKALGGLKKNFSGASVVEVSTGASSSSPSSSGSNSPSSKSSSSSGSTSGKSKSTTPTPSSASKPTGAGRSYEEKSKNLPNVVETG
jgi:hypothetical protein